MDLIQHNNFHSSGVTEKKNSQNMLSFKINTAMLFFGILLNYITIIDQINKHGILTHSLTLCVLPN